MRENSTNRCCKPFTSKILYNGSSLWLHIKLFLVGLPIPLPRGYLTKCLVLLRVKMGSSQLVLSRQTKSLVPYCLNRLKISQFLKKLAKHFIKLPYLYRFVATQIIRYQIGSGNTIKNPAAASSGSVTMLQG